MLDNLVFLKRKWPPIKDKPALVLVAFGTSSPAQVVFDCFYHQLQKQLPAYKVYWAFTSDILRARSNRKGRRVLSLHETLAALRAEGFLRAVVQPLFVFPGLEYREVLEVCRSFPGLRLLVGEPLFMRWSNVSKVLELVKPRFLPEKEGLNILVAHGTDLASDGANMVYLGLDYLVEQNFSNVVVATVEGIPGVERALTRAKVYPGAKVQFLPLMYVAGYHIMQDVLGAKDSWRKRLEAAGKQVLCPTLEYQGLTLYQGLGFYPEINNLFIQEIKRLLSFLEAL